MSRKPVNNFDPAHYFYSQALVATSNPYSLYFSCSRNLSVHSLKAMDSLLEVNPLERLQNAKTNLLETKSKLIDLKSSASDIAALRNAIEGMFNKAPVETHVDLFMQDDESESGKEDDWDTLGSDEEVVA